MELGDEVVIPPALLQKDISQCYQFYNPVCNIIEELCQDHKRNLYISKNTQLMRMAHIEMVALQTLFRRF